ncbi:uncharacterized protein ZHAS_00012379 [Anopheles sinensis]|uniref:Uncharacterized protein n=1 Tax=Anopheles sinensis TaxID=74873 RepID=A0A084W2Q9_ANOSI|nr:uncharacterized protein ZHAS_00012379 [Anopheles sinensis]
MNPQHPAVVNKNKIKLLSEHAGQSGPSTVDDPISRARTSAGALAKQAVGGDGHPNPGPVTVAVDCADEARCKSESDGTTRKREE